MKPFSLLLKPAAADCNLRCGYCFYLDRAALYPATAAHRMSDAVLERVIRSYMATPQPQYAFGWQGGEPTLMGLDFFRRVTALQAKHGRPGAVVANGLQTNGTLIDDALAKHLARYRFLVGVSLDGSADVHDRYRRAPGGHGSHADVLRGIAALRRREVEFNILTLVSQANVRRAAEVYRYLCKQGFLYHQYIECVEFDGAARLMPYAVTGDEWGAFLCELYDTWIVRDTRRVSIRLFDTILSILVDGAANTCSSGRDCRQYFVVEHNGDVYPCDFYVRPELKLGNILESGWEALVAAPTYCEFGNLKSRWNEACASCQYLRLCAGDCLRNRRWERGADPRQLSHLCAGWQRFYRHALPGLERLADEIRAARAARFAALPEALPALPDSVFHPSA
jgi:uncharacterized protein